MAGWQEELAALLRELGVTQEDETPYLPPLDPEDDLSQLPMFDWQEDRDVQFADASFWGNPRAGKKMDAPWVDDLSSMKSDVDAIVAQLIHFMQHGRIDPTVREDVMIVLRALRHRAAVTRQAREGELARIESASAILHFCRLVLRLNEAKKQTE